jgi:cytochrome c-type biogenesis protein CcmE
LECGHSLPLSPFPPGYFKASPLYYGQLTDNGDYSTVTDSRNLSMTTGRKLALAGIVVVSVTGYMAYLGASSSWQYYLTAEECLAHAADLSHGRIRVCGTIATGSLRISQDHREASFALEAGAGQLAVTCTGLLPDNLAERIDVVVEGRLDEACVLRGEKVLTRCASKYKSRAAAGATPDAAPSGREIAT